MGFLKLLSEHFGVIKPGEYDIGVRLAVSEIINLVVFLWRRIWWWFAVEQTIATLRHGGILW